MAAAIAAAKRRGKLARRARWFASAQRKRRSTPAQAASIHIFADEAPDAAFVQRAIAAKAFVIPTLSVNESTTGAASGAELVKDVEHRHRISRPPNRAALESSFPKRPNARRTLDYSKAATRMLHDAGRSDSRGERCARTLERRTAPAFTASCELLVDAGLTPAAALTAATAAPALAFSLEDRGRIAPGLRADLVLVARRPDARRQATRDIVAIWKGGERFERPRPGAEPTAPLATTSDGVVSDFDTGETPAARFGAGWQVSTDTMLGGKSTAELRMTQGGAAASAGALEVTGSINAGSAVPRGRARCSFRPRRR